MSVSVIYELVYFVGCVIR